MDLLSCTHVIGASPRHTHTTRGPGEGWDQLSQGQLSPVLHPMRDGACLPHPCHHCVVAGEGMAQLSTILRHQHGLTWQPRHDHMVFGGDKDPRCRRATDPDLAFGRSTGPATTMASGGRASFSHQAVPHRLLVSSSSSLHSEQTAQLLSLFHPSTTYLFIAVVPTPAGPLWPLRFNVLTQLNLQRMSSRLKSHEQGGRYHSQVPEWA